MDFYCSKWRIQFHPKWVIEFDRTYWIIEFSSITSHFGLYRMNNCRFKRQNLNRSRAAWLNLGKRRMNNCRFKRQNLNWSSAACVDLINTGWTIVVLNDNTWTRVVLRDLIRIVLVIFIIKSICYGFSAFKYGKPIKQAQQRFAASSPTHPHIPL